MALRSCWRRFAGNRSAPPETIGTPDSTRRSSSLPRCPGKTSPRRCPNRTPIRPSPPMWRPRSCPIRLRIPTPIPIRRRSPESIPRSRPIRSRRWTRSCWTRTRTRSPRPKNLRRRSGRPILALRPRRRSRQPSRAADSNSYCRRTGPTSRPASVAASSSLRTSQSLGQRVARFVAGIEHGPGRIRIGHVGRPSARRLAAVLHRRRRVTGLERTVCARPILHARTRRG